MTHDTPAVHPFWVTLERGPQRLMMIVNVHVTDEEVDRDEIERVARKEMRSHGRSNTDWETTEIVDLYSLTPEQLDDRAATLWHDDVERSPGVASFLTVFIFIGRRLPPARIVG